MTSVPQQQVARTVSVLVIDDSALVREVICKILSQADGISVTTAADAIIGLGKMERSRPDVIVLDLEMPRMDGLSFLRKVMQHDPIPVVVCSAMTGATTDLALRALEEGAVEIVTKPKIGVRDFLEESATLLCDAVRAAANARLSRRTLRPTQPSLTADLTVARPSASRLARPAHDTIVAIGASTGGPDALQTILQGMPVDAPGILVVQHMPEGFTRAFAKRLNETCRISVKQAEHGDRVARGCALVAPGNRHMRLARSREGFSIEVYDGPLVSRHRPSVDVLFRSVAAAAGRNAVGILLTGMGSDGAEGLLEMKELGAATIAQDESTSVVFGMPGAAVELGAAVDVVPLPRIASVLLNRSIHRVSGRHS